MAKVLGIKSELQKESYQAGSATSSNSVTLLAQNVQYLKENAPFEIVFRVNGNMGNLINGFVIDCCDILPTDCNLISFSFACTETGSAGDIEFDLFYYNADDSSPVSIFSTKPKINNAANNGAWYSKNILTDTVNHTQAGITEPVISTTAFAAGSKLVATITSTATDSRDLFIKMIFVA